MGRRHTFRTWDDYFIPGTSVLRNKFTAPGKPYGEVDPRKLRMLEEAHAHSRIQELAEKPIQGRFDYDHMKAIHLYLFQDVYEWAGQERIAPVGELMTKDGHAYYGADPHLAEAAEAEYAKLASKDLLRGLEPEGSIRRVHTGTAARGLREKSMSAIGYARVSTRDQNLGSQDAAPREAACKRVFID